MENSELNSLLENSKFISQTLAELKKQFAGGQNSGLSASEEIERGVALKEAFRTQAEGLEVNRNLVQLKKDQIEKSRVFLEGLQYYKATLKGKIKECEIHTEDLDQYLQNPLTVPNWEQDFAPIEKQLEKELENVKLQKKDFQERIEQRENLNRQIKKKEKIYNEDLPQIVGKLHDQVEETSKLFGIQPQQELKQIKDPKLAKIFDLLYPLKETEKIEVSFENDQYQAIEVHLKENPCYRLCKIASQNNISLEPKGIKFVIASMIPQLGPAIGVDRSSDFSTQQIFQRLINNEPVKPVYTNPTSESERNVNNKYCFLQWIEVSICSGVVSGTQFLDYLRERIFCLQLNRHLIDNLKKLPYFTDLTKMEQGGKPSLKKVNYSQASRISFDEYKELSNAPNWIAKQLITNELNRISLKQLSLEEQISTGVQKNNLSGILELYSMEEMDLNGLNNYFKVKINVFNEVFVAVLIVPHAFPNSPSKIRFIDHLIGKPDEKSKNHLQGLVLCYNQDKKTASPSLNPRIIAIERELNNEIEQFQKGSESASFRLFLQINRLVSLMWNWHESIERKGFAGKREFQ